MTDQSSGTSVLGYRVLARKYRPQNFADLIGQEAIVRTLGNAFASGRIAQAYMLTGVRGVGKTTIARLIARAINYPSGPALEMPELTAQCEAILESRHIDVIEMDAASNTGVDNIREIIDSVRYAPVSARYKVYIVDEVHMLSKSAFNALLKTLEEPPPHVKFIFATTEIRKVPVTILSRCQRFDLKRLDAALLARHYADIAAREDVTAEPDALAMIARAAEGSVRDGLSLLDQAIAYGEGEVRAADVSSMLGLIDRGRTIDLLESVMAGDPARAILALEDQFKNGGDALQALIDLADLVHWVTRIKVAKDSALADPARTEIEKQRGADLARRLGMAHLTRAWSMLLKGIRETELQSETLLAAEMVLIRLAHAADLPSSEELVKLSREGADMGKAGALPPSKSPQQEGQAPESVGAVALQSTPATTPAPDETRSFSSLQDILAIAAEKRDIKLKGELERLVRPIRIGPGQFELALEPSAPPGLPAEIARKLESWTGMRWMVMVAKEGGDKPVRDQNRERRDGLFQSARDNPDVRAILKRFPSAEIVDVRDTELHGVSEDDEESR